MQAIVYGKYGNPDVLQLKEVEKPIPKPDEVLIKVQAVALNASDMEFLRGEPAYVKMWGLWKPKYQILGSDIAGTIEAIGEKATNFKIGDEVFCDLLYKWGGLAEYICAAEKELVLKPKEMTFQMAAAIPQAGTVALQALRDKGQIKAGQKVLINGAGGGTGTFAIQLAKYFGATVTGIDNRGKLALMLSVGADQVMDYTKDDFSKNEERYDLIVDFVAHRSIFDYKKVLKPNGRYVLVGGSIKRLLQALFIGPVIGLTSNKKMGFLAHEQNKKDIETMLNFYKTGKVVPIIEKSYPLAEVPTAFWELMKGEVKGKLVIKIGC